MAYLTNYQYYENAGVSPTTTNQGSYQYVSISDLVKNFMFAYVGQNKAVDNVDSSLVRWHMKQCIKDLNYTALREIKAMEILIGDDLKAVMPHDYVNYVRISLEVNGVLFPLSENQSAMTSKAYLLDSNDDLQFDGSGTVLYTTSELDTARLAGTNEYVSDDCCTTYSFGGQFGGDPSKMNGNPKFRVHKKSGVIDFDSSMAGKLIVLEYISDGMEAGDDSDISLNKFFEKYCYYYTVSEILDSKTSVPVVKAQEWRKKKRAQRNNSKIMMMDLEPGRLIMSLRGQQKWIK